jgi:hypothetical protein
MKHRIRPTLKLTSTSFARMNISTAESDWGGGPEGARTEHGMHPPFSLLQSRLKSERAFAIGVGPTCGQLALLPCPLEGGESTRAEPSCG